MKAHLLKLVRSLTARRPGTPLPTMMAAVTGVLVITACQGASTVPNTSGVAGYYSLVTVNDTALPRIVAKDAQGVSEIVGDTIALSPTGTWADLTVYSETFGPNVSTTQNIITGSFTLGSDSTTLFFRSSNGDSFTGSLTANRKALLIVGTLKALYVKSP